MNHSMWVGVALGAALATLGGTWATSGFFRAKPNMAEVLTVKPIKEMAQVPVEHCQEVQVSLPSTSSAQTQNEYQKAGEALGAIVGNLFGDESGQKLAAWLGTVTGGPSGQQQAQQQQAPSVRTTTERRCTSVMGVEERVMGYEVRYIQDGELKQVRTDYDPGRQIVLDQGGPVLTQARLHRLGHSVASD